MYATKTRLIVVVSLFLISRSMSRDCRNMLVCLKLSRASDLLIELVQGPEFLEVKVQYGQDGTYNRLPR